MRSPRWLTAAALASLVLSACGGGDPGTNPPPPPPPPPPAPVVSSISVTAPSPVLSIGESAQLTAVVKDQSGLVIQGKTVTWSSNSDQVATVSAAGLVTGVSAGLVTVTAAADGKLGTVDLTVTPAQPAACTQCLEVVPGTLLLSGIGAHQQLVAFTVDAAGHRTLASATYTNSDPSVVTVSPTGLVTAVAALGSSRITARAGAQTSAPLMVLVAQPVAGALLVSDAQIEGSITPVDPTATYGPGYQFKMRLLGPAPTVGQVVLGTGALPVGGKVVSVTAAGAGKSDVVLQLLTIDGMFQSIEVNQQMSLDNSPGLTPAAISEAYTVDKMPDGTVRYQPRARRRLAATNVVRQFGPAASPNTITFSLGQFECEAKVQGALTFPLIADAFRFSMNPSLTLDLVVSNLQVQRFVVHGSITPMISSNPVLNAAVAGSVECTAHLRTLILPIGGPLSLIIGGQVPLGVGFGADAKTELAGIGADLFLQATVAASFGIDCAAGCQGVGDVSVDAGGFFKPVLPPNLGALRNELSMSAYGYAELQIGNPFIRALQFKAVTIKAGLQQKAELASEQGQADDASYASSFALSPLLEAETTSDLTALEGLLKIRLAQLSFAPTLPQLAHSPMGTFTISPASVLAGDATQLGQTATFTVTLNPVSYLGSYAVDGVEIRWLKDDGTGHLVLQPGRPGCTSIAPPVTGQTVFTCQTDFLDTTPGAQKFFAFVKVRLFGIPLPIFLEVGSDGATTVTVTKATAQITNAVEGSVNGDPACTDHHQNQGEASLSGQVDCTKFGTTWHLQGANSSTPGHGTLSGALSRSGTPSNITQASVGGFQLVQDVVTINVPGLAGTQGSFRASMDITGSLTATGPCGGNDLASASYFVNGQAIDLAGTSGQFLLKTIAYAFNPCSHGGTLPPTTDVGDLITFTYGTPFNLSYTVNALVVADALHTGSATGSVSIGFHWLGMTGLPPGATMTSASGVNWILAAP